MAVDTANVGWMDGWGLGVQATSVSDSNPEATSWSYCSKGYCAKDELRPQALTSSSRATVPRGVHMGRDEELQRSGVAAAASASRTAGLRLRLRLLGWTAGLLSRAC